MKLPITISLLCIAPFLISCQSTQDELTFAKVTNDVYLDHAFELEQPIHIESGTEVFELDDDMRTMVQKKLMPIADTRRRSRKLLEHIFEAENINLQYVGGANLTAKETYHSRTANCISLTIMAYALAQEADLNVSFQDVEIPEYWQRNGSYTMLTGHVNLLVKKERSAHTTVFITQSVLEIDFDPYVAKKSFNKRIISKQTMLAMFYNNKGAEALARGDYAVAYHYLKEATKTDNNFSPAWGNLGILYKTNGYKEQAELAYQKAINLDNDNNTALNNYAILLRQDGHYEEAEDIELAILKKRISNPYYYALLGDEALHRKDFHHAINHYRKAIRMNNQVDEFYAGLAKAYYQMNKIREAKSALRTAIAINKVPRTDEQYIAKLDFLKQTEMTH